MPKQQSIHILAPAISSSEEPRNYYLWSYQSNFWISAKLAAEGVFKRLDERLIPDVFLVAVNTEAESKHPKAVVEPEYHDFTASDFESVIDLTRESEKASPGPSYGWQADDRFGEAWAARGKRRDFINGVRTSIRQVVANAHKHEPAKVFVSPGREFGPYVVFTVLTINEELSNEYPRLHQTCRGRYSVVPSLIDAVASRVSECCWERIVQSFGGDSFVNFPPCDDILRASAASFMYTPFGSCDEIYGLHGGFEICNEISTLTYEKAVGRGRLILAKRGHHSIEEVISFTTPISLRNFRAVRKLLEMAGPDEALICDSKDVVALGSVRSTYDPSKEDLFCVEFTGHAKWQLLHAGAPLMRVEHGLPSLPQESLRVARFVETFSRLFPNASDRQHTGIRRIAHDATELTHGTIIIIHSRAADEATRFGRQALLIEPKPLSPELMKQASRIDGAILAGPDGVCHAIGVILDGPVSDKGSNVRGARYNSTVRYVYASGCEAMGLVVSDDGMIDMVPEYRPVVSRHEIEKKIAELDEIVGNETISQRKLNNVTEWLSKQRFYLSSLQCDRINSLIVSSQEKKRDSSAGNVIYESFTQHPEMNDSFLKD